MSRKKKFDCYKCEYRRGVPGSAHSSCHHPSLKELHKNPMLNLLAVFASVDRVPPIALAPKEMNIKADPHGIRRGWFNFPWNFDPVWLLNCDGYQPKKKERRRT